MKQSTFDHGKSKINYWKSKENYLFEHLHLTLSKLNSANLDFFRENVEYGSKNEQFRDYLTN